jgi:hypothetical protein
MGRRRRRKRCRHFFDRLHTTGKEKNETGYDHGPRVKERHTPLVKPEIKTELQI